MILISTLGYLGTGVLYFFVLLLLLTVWRGRRLGGYLVAACLATLVWAVTNSLPVGATGVRPEYLFLAEVARAATWLAFISVLVRQLGVSRVTLFVPHLAWIVMLLVGLPTAYFGQVPGISWSLTDVLLFGGLAVSLAGLMLIEQLYRNSPIDSRWALKPLMLGVGGLFAYDLFMFSQGLLFNGIDTATWIARGWVNVLFVPLLVTAVRRNPTWELRIFVSRQVVFYTTTLVAVGVYLLAVSAGGYLLIEFGGSWTGVVRVVFLAGAILVLLLLLFSGAMRSKLRVFLSKHFFQNKYDYRQEWQRLINTLSEFEDSSTRQVVIQAMAQIVESPGGHLWVLDESGELFRLAASYSTEDPAPNISIDDPIIDFMRRDSWIVDLKEFDRDPSRYEDLEIPRWLRDDSRAWLLVPLLSGKDLVGVIELHEAPNAPSLNYEDRDLLKTVGRHIAVHLMQERSDSLLVQAQQFEAYNRLTAFLMHDLNNLVAQLSLIVKNAEKHKTNPDFIDDSIKTIANSVDRMQSVLSQLKRGERGERPRRSSVLTLVESAVRRCSNRAPVPVIDSSVDSLSIVVNPENLDMVLSHLIRNAQEATPSDGNVRVHVDADGDFASITISDTGAGMTADFISDRLFRPFDSTKGTQGMGIGAHQAREFARSAGGQLVVESEPGRGTVMQLRLPIAPG